MCGGREKKIAEIDLSLRARIQLFRQFPTTGKGSLLGGATLVVGGVLQTYAHPAKCTGVIDGIR